MAKSFQLRGGEANRTADAATVCDVATTYADSATVCDVATTYVTAAIDTTASAEAATSAAISWMTLQPLQEAQGQEHRKQHQPAFLLCAR